MEIIFCLTILYGFTFNINASHDYRRAQCEKTLLSIKSEKRDAKPDVCAFRKPAFFLIKCLVDIITIIYPIMPESFLFGIGSTNLVKPLELPKPSMNNLKSVPFFENSATIIPDPLIIEREQRPVIFRR